MLIAGNIEIQNFWSDIWRKEENKNDAEWLQELK